MSGARGFSNRSSVSASARPEEQPSCTGRTSPTYCSAWFTTNDVVVRGQEFETTAAYADRGVRQRDHRRMDDEVPRVRGFGFLADIGAAGIKHVCRSAFAAQHDPDEYPLTSRYDEMSAMIIFDDVKMTSKKTSSTGAPRRPRSSAPTWRPASVRTSSATCASRLPPRRRLRHTRRPRRITRRAREDRRRVPILNAGLTRAIG